jgi:hypothetical protein
MYIFLFPLDQGHVSDRILLRLEIIVIFVFKKYNNRLNFFKKK